MTLEQKRIDYSLNDIEIGIAKTPEEKEKIYRLRYHIYAEEIPFKLVSVDHEKKILYDDLDEWGTLFYATDGLEFIGTVTQLSQRQNRLNRLPLKPS